MALTLFQEFLAAQLAAYIEPCREGTPRGETIGLSTKKFEACLLMLSTNPLKDIAEQVGASYALIRKWRTEGIFRNTLCGLQVEFAERLVAATRRRAENAVAADESAFDLPIEEVGRQAPASSLDFALYHDAASYSGDLRGAILLRMARALGDCDHDISTWVHLLIDYLFLRAQWGMPLNDPEDQIRRQILNNLHEYVERGLRAPTEENRKVALMALAGIRSLGA